MTPRNEVLHGKHGSQTIDELDHVLAVHTRASGIRYRLVVAPIDVHRKTQRIAWNGVCEKTRLRGERRNRPASKFDLRHRDPSRELPYGLGDETRRECIDGGRDRILSDRAPSRVELGDAVDERECGKVISHA